MTAEGRLHQGDRQLHVSVPASLSRWSLLWNCRHNGTFDWFDYFTQVVLANFGDGSKVISEPGAMSWWPYMSINGTFWVHHPGRALATQTGRALPGGSARRLCAARDLQHSNVAAVWFFCMIAVCCVVVKLEHVCGQTDFYGGQNNPVVVKTTLVVIKTTH